MTETPLAPAMLPQNRAAAILDAWDRHDEERFREALGDAALTGAECRPDEYERGELLAAIAEELRLLASENRMAGARVYFDLLRHLARS